MNALARIITLCCLAALPLLAQPQRSTKGSSVLGVQTRLMIPVADLLTSVAWYGRLGWTPTYDVGSRTDTAITLTDGQVRATVTTSRLPATVVVFASRDMRALKGRLDSLGLAIIADMKGPTYGEIRFKSPNGVHVLVRSNVDEPEIVPDNFINPVCGVNTEFSIAVPTLKTEVLWWEALGFKQVRGGMVPYPHAVMSDGRCCIGLHENKDIPSLAITYFSKDMEQRIDRVKKGGMTIDEEIPTADGRVANAILRSADGQLIFMFEGEPQKDAPVATDH